MDRLTITNAANLIRSRDLRSVDLVSACLQRLASTESEVNAYVLDCSESALAAARAADIQMDAGRYVGPLHGIPISIKDNIDVAGLHTSAGSRILPEGNATEDATVVKRLTRAGAIIVGKTNMHEFALGATTVNPHFGTTRNPWDLERIASGSSGGSAVSVTSGSCLASVGTDTGGSVRLPAAMTGVVGLRPTFGRVSVAGVFPLAPSVDTVGPITCSVNDAALMLQVMAGHDPSDRRSSERAVPDYGVGGEQAGLSGVNLAVMRPFATSDLEAGVETTFAAALEDLRALGARIVEIRTPRDFDVFPNWHIVRRAETARIHEQLFSSRAGEYGDDIRNALRSYMGISASEYIRGQEIRAVMTAEFLDVLTSVDAILTPTSPFVALPIGQDWVELDGKIFEPVISQATRYTNLASGIGAPALSVPCGFVDGLPVGLQMIASPFAERELFRIARIYENVNSWHMHLPGLTARNAEASGPRP